MGANTTSRRVRPARGYVVAGRVAADQLRGGRPVVADASTAWLSHVRGRGSVARECGVPIHVVVEAAVAVLGWQRRRALMRQYGSGLSIFDDLTAEFCPTVGA